MIIQFAFVVPSIAQYNVWSMQQSNTANSLYGIDFINSSTGWAVGESGTILKSTTGGITWVQQTSGVSNTLAAVDFVDSLVGYAVGNDIGIILKTTDGGLSWTEKDNGRMASSVYFVSSTTGWVVGADGLILKTTDGGESWAQQIVQDLYSYLTSVYFINADTGWVGGLIPGVLLKTTDGGSSWVSATSGIDFGEDVNAMFFANASVGWIAGYGFPDTVGVGIIKKTTDGGETWISQVSNVNQPLLSGAFLDTLNGWIVGNGGTILKTTNGGDVWTTETSGVSNGLDKIVVRMNEGGWIVGFGGIILRNNFGGLMQPVSVTMNTGWNMISLPLNLLDRFKPAVFPTAVSSAFSYVSSQGYLTDDTLDVGTGYWVKFSNAQDVSFSGAQIDSMTLQLTSGWNLVGGISVAVPVSRIIQQPSNSITNVYQYTPTGYSADTVLTPGKAYWIKVIQNSTITLTSSQAIVSGTALSDISGLQNNELPPPPPPPADILADNDIQPATLPTEYRLAQNYPNPFNPTTKINYDIPEQSTVRVSVFNILGQEVVTLVNGVVGAGYHSIEWDASSNSGTVLPSGIYMYRIQTTSLVTGKEFSQVRKMLLMK